MANTHSPDPRPQPAAHQRPAAQVRPGDEKLSYAQMAKQFGKDLLKMKLPRSELDKLGAPLIALKDSDKVGPHTLRMNPAVVDPIIDGLLDKKYGRTPPDAAQPVAGAKPAAPPVAAKPADGVKARKQPPPWVRSIT